MTTIALAGRIDAPMKERTKSILLCVSLSTVLLAILGAVAWYRVTHRPVKAQPGTATLHTPKAALYGSAYPPHHPVETLNPDTGAPWHDLSNSEGWNDVEHAFEKPPGGFRILCLGDSLTWGVVAQSNNWPRVLERMLNERSGSPSRSVARVEVISIGIPGWGNDSELRALEFEGVRYRPDVVVLQFCWNDLYDNLLPVDPRPRNEKPSGKRFQYKLRAGSGSASRSAVLEYVAVTNAIAQSDVPIPRRDKMGPLDGDWPPLFQEGWKITEAIFVRMKELSEGCGAKFLVASASGDEYELQAYLNDGTLHRDARGVFHRFHGTPYYVEFDRTTREARAICARHGIPFVTRTTNYPRYRIDHHFNADGCRLFAADVAAAIFDGSSKLQTPSTKPSEREGVPLRPSAREGEPLPAQK